MIADIWWLILVRAFVLLAVGISFLVRPETPLTVVILLMGTYWFVDGVLTVARSFRARHTVGYWGFGVLVGIVGIIAGAIVFTRPVASALLTTGFVVVFLAVAAIVAGLTSLATGLRSHGESGRLWYLIGGGVSVAFGAALLASPLYSILQLVRILGGVAVIVGAVSFVDAWRVRGATAGSHPPKGT
jgi:uncharacterized membrane protein HdeD (DUF308 family)